MLIIVRFTNVNKVDIYIIIGLEKYVTIGFDLFILIILSYQICKEVK